MVLGCLVVLSVGLAQPGDAGRTAIPRSEKLKSAGGTGSVRFHGLGKNLALPRPRLLPVPWKLNEESISVDDIPARAFDTPEEKQRVAAILEQYNNDLTLTLEEDAEFSKLARSAPRAGPCGRTSGCPLLRAVAIWFHAAH